MKRLLRMDPPAMMDEGSSNNLVEIWQLPLMNGGGGGMVMGSRRPQFSDVNDATNREVSGNDSMSLDQRGVHGGGGNGGGSRTRHDLEDDSSNSNGAVFLPIPMGGVIWD